MPLLLTTLTFVSTFLGGLLGLRYKDKLHLILGFTAGVLLGVVAFDIFPEIFELVNKLQMDPHLPMIALVAGFLGFHVVEKIILIHHSQEEEYGLHHHPTVGLFSALATSLRVSGTPGFFINETPYAGAYSYKDMESTVNKLLGS